MFEIEIQQLSNDLSEMLPNVLKKASAILGRDVNQQSINAIIGGKNITHAHVWDRTFSCYEEFLAIWLDAMYQDYVYRKDYYDPMDRAGYRNAMLLREPEIMEYVEKFLRRNFLRYYKERTNGMEVTQNEVDDWRNKVESQKRTFKMI